MKLNKHTYLFRGKNVKNGEWVYGGICDYESGIEILKVSGWEGSLYDPPYTEVEEVEVDRNTVGQNIGLHDKDEKDLYEGDIICCEHVWSPSDEQVPCNPFEVSKTDYNELAEKAFSQQTIKGAYNKTFDQTRYGWDYFLYYRNYIIEYNYRTGGWRARNKDVIKDITRDFLYNRGAKLIGNIYDNPELMNDVEDQSTVVHRKYSDTF